MVYFLFIIFVYMNFFLNCLRSIGYRNVYGLDFMGIFKKNIGIFKINTEFNLYSFIYQLGLGNQQYFLFYFVKC